MIERRQEMDEKESILIIDDDESTSRILALVFGKKGYETEVAATGREALEKAQRRFFNVALVDIKLPDMEGMELLAPLHKIHPDMVMIMVTGYASVENAVRALNEGASAYITKPLNMDEVLSRVREALEKQGLVMENRRLYETEKRLRQEMEEEARVRGNFINTLAHEIRTPLIPVTISARMLKDSFSSRAESSEFRLSNNILDTTQELVARLDRLLDLAQFSSGTFTLDLQPLDTGAFLEKTASEFQSTAEGKDQYLALRLSQTLPLIQADQARLGEVLMNLLSNAGKFSPEGTSITLSARAEGGELMIEVEDQGG